ncbi:aldolase [Methanococcoides sp. AM1]|uniref:aldolase n=1 Tax=Methanococcoides sp. AM1 TaxID=1201011 RepID=UPI0010835587|nr:aldolase [Methanococcoides sp. AM1]
MWQEIAKYGKKLVDHGLVESNFGNISVRIGSRMMITRSGAALDEITDNSVVEVPIERTSELDRIASTETIVHRAIYRNTPALAILHAHCPYSVAQTLIADSDNIIPFDSEGIHFLHEIPIFKGMMGTAELAEEAAKALSNHRGAIAYSHGTFALGKTLADAYIVTTQIEHSCRIKYLVDLAKK